MSKDGQPSKDGLAVSPAKSAAKAVGLSKASKSPARPQLQPHDGFSNRVSTNMADIEKLEDGKHFNRWLDRFRVAARFYRWTDEDMAQVLLMRLSPSLYDVLADQMSPDLPSSKSFEELRVVLQEILQPQTYALAERYTFQSMQREPTESIRSFAERLLKASDKCLFTNREERLRDQLIFGLNDKTIVAKLLVKDHEELTFKMAVAEAEAVSALKDTKIMQSASGPRSETVMKLGGCRFLDTMSLHIGMRGLTGNQRTLKLMAKNGRFANKRWAEYQRYRQQRGADSVDTADFGRLAWVSDSALNNLADVFALCTGQDAEADAKDELREHFISGSLDDVRSRLSGLLAYCARDVWMTHRVLVRQWADFDKHFPSPVTLGGLLEMGSVLLPTNSCWDKYKRLSQAGYDELLDGQRQTLQRLADEAVKKFANGGHESDPWLWDLDWSVGQSKTGLPKWYRDLVPKPVEKNVDQGARLVTAQMRIAPKLLRLTWRGFPLHHDAELKWGRLVPGRNPSPGDSDPRYFDADTGRLLPTQPAVKTVAAGSSELRFPLAAYCHACLPSLMRCLRQHELLAPQQAVQSRWRQRQLWRRLSADLAASLRMLPLEGDAEAAIDELLAAIHSAASRDGGEPGAAAAGKEEEYNWERQLPCALTATPLDDGAAFKRAANPCIDACWFCALPHPQGTSVGNPLSKSFLAAIDAGLLGSDRPEVGELLRMHSRSTYWQGASKRVNSQLALPLSNSSSNNGDGIRLILPQVVAMGTVSRRAVEPLWLTASNARRDRLGSELKAMVQAPPGYRVVGADVDSQELWIASMAGDAEFDDSQLGRRRIHGATAISWMNLRGSKAEGTDLHSVSARLINVSREHAKVLNYARFYGSGAANIAKLLCQFDPGIDKQLAADKAKRLLRETKGKRAGGLWQGGSESFLFNHMERIAGLESPRTPFLGAALSCALRTGSTGGDFATSRINWVIQSSAVDYLHCLLVACRWLIDKYSINARFAISIHDEVRYLVRESDSMRFALALQLANLLTRAFFASRLGFRDLPQSVAFFSGVDIDACMRKDPLDDCVTPSNSAGLRAEYGIEPGVTLDIKDILKATGGRLEAPIESAN